MSDSTRIIKNSVFLYGRKIISIIASIYSVRFVLKNLGIEDYGIYSLLGGLIAMLAFFNNAMISSTQRHLSYNMGVGSKSEINNVFNASFQIHILIATMVVLLGESLGLFLVYNILEIPISRMNAALWVYQSVIFIIVFDILSVPFQAITNAKEEMQVIAVRDIIHSLGKLLVAIILGYIFVDRLIIYSVLMLILNFVISFSFYWFCKKNYTDLSIKLKKYSKKLYSDLTGFAGWTLFGSLAAVSRNQGNAIILNLFFGPNINAAYGIANQLSSQALSVSNIFLQASNPQIVKSFGSGDKMNSYRLSNLISRFSFYVLFLFSMPVIINVDYILNLWLSEVPKYSNIFCQLLLINFLVGIISNPLITLIQATGEIKMFQIVNGGLFLLNIPLAYILLYLDFPSYSIFFGLIIITFIGIFVKLYFINHLDEFPVKLWLKDVMLNVSLVVILTILLYYIVFSFISFNSETSYVLGSFTTCLIITLILIFLVGLKNKERKYLLTVLTKKFKN